MRSSGYECQIGFLSNCWSLHIGHAMRAASAVLAAVTVLSIGCADSNSQTLSNTPERMTATFKVGHALIGVDNNLASVDLVIGSRSGPAGDAFAHAFVSQRDGHPAVLAVLGPDIATKPSTVINAKVTIKDMNQALKFFEPAQSAIAEAVADSVIEGVISADRCEDWVVICTVFIHPSADDDKAVHDNNYEATKLALKRALHNEPTVEDITGHRRSERQ